MEIGQWVPIYSFHLHWSEISVMINILYEDEKSYREVVVNVVNSIAL